MGETDRQNMVGLHCHGLPLVLAGTRTRPAIATHSLSPPSSVLSGSPCAPSLSLSLSLSLRVYVYHNNFGIWWREGLKPEGNQDR
jgi:hypothetical protein